MIVKPNRLPSSCGSSAVAFGFVGSVVQCFHDRNDQIFGSFSTQNHIAPPTSSLITCLKVERGSEQQELIVLQGVAGNAVLLWIGCVGRA